MQRGDAVVLGEDLMDSVDRSGKAPLSIAFSCFMPSIPGAVPGIAP